MACPNCDETMQATDVAGTWWCPRCGTLRIKRVGYHTPKITAGLQQQQTKMIPNIFVDPWNYMLPAERDACPNDRRRMLKARMKNPERKT